MKKENRIRDIIRILINYLTFFSLVAFVISCCMALFITILANSLELILTKENLDMAAKLTFLNVVFLSFIFCVIDIMQREISVESTVGKGSVFTVKIRRL